MYIKSFETELLKSIDKDIFTAQEHPYIIEKEFSDILQSHEIVLNLSLNNPC